MLRNIYTVSATQVITSDQNPFGLKSNLPDFPKDIDSRSFPAPDGNPNGNTDTVSKTFYTNAGTGEFIVPN